MTSISTPAPAVTALAAGEAARSTIPAASRALTCTACDGWGQLSGYLTIDPSERATRFECPHCKGSGWEPDPETEDGEDE